MEELQGDEDDSVRRRLGFWPRGARVQAHVAPLVQPEVAAGQSDDSLNIDNSLNTPHTRGFFWRIDHLYHLALDTPADRRKPLVWIKQGSAWRVDWRKLR